MKRHLDTFVSIFVMHVVNDVHRIDVDFTQPIHHSVKSLQDMIKIEVVTGHRSNCRPNLVAADFVSAAIDGIEETLCQVGASAKELHLFSNQHWRHAARNGSVVSPGGSHD